MDLETMFKLFDLGFPGPPWILEHIPKSSDNSEKCRLAGNKVFKARDFEKAIEFYNASLCYAPTGSAEIPVIFANRSAAYCEMNKYALALENIKLARDNGFPAEKMAQLDNREKKCKKLKEVFGPDKNVEAREFFQLSHPPNEKIPFIAGCLELRQSEKYGRGIHTNKDLKTGDIIAIERPAMAWINGSVGGVFCLFCTKFKEGSLLPCSHCTSVMFCSEECKEKAALLHLNDAFNGVYSGEFNKSLKMQLDAYRIAGGVSELLELLKDSEDKTIFDFDFSNPDDPSYEKNMLVALNGLCKNYVENEIPEINPKTLLNIPPINEKKRTAQERKQLIKFITNQLALVLSNLTLFKQCHNGIYLLQSLLNHSCVPNVECIRLDEKSVLIVIRPIKRGDQIFEAYGAYAAYHSKEVRALTLQKKHSFQCDCEACFNDWRLPFPTKDPRFIEPEFQLLEPADAIKHFKQNCKYIDENAEKIPSEEIRTSMENNLAMLELIAGNKIEGSSAISQFLLFHM